MRYCTAVLHFRGCGGSALGALERFLSQRNASSRRSRRSASQTFCAPSSRGCVQPPHRVVSPITAAQRAPCERSPRSGEPSLKELPLHSSQVFCGVCGFSCLMDQPPRALVCLSVLAGPGPGPGPNTVLCSNCALLCSDCVWSGPRAGTPPSCRVRRVRATSKPGFFRGCGDGGGPRGRSNVL